MKIICKYCSGNGYRRIWANCTEKEKITIQCAMCESQGEIESDQYEEPERKTQ